MKIPSPYENYPPSWSVFERYVPMVSAAFFGFDGTTADINRFAARYRAARCFQRAEFSGLTSDTADGYSMLCRLLLIYSAFEYFLRSLGIEQHNTSTLLEEDERDKVLANLRSLGGQAELFEVLRRFVNTAYKRQIDAHIRNQACNPVYLAGAIRHAFAHGALTATPSGVPAQTVATVSRYLGRVLMRIMEREFEKRMLETEREIHQAMEA